MGAKDYNNVLENFRNKMTVQAGLKQVYQWLGWFIRGYYKLMYVYYEVRLLIKGLLWGKVGLIGCQEWGQVMLDIEMIG